MKDKSYGYKVNFSVDGVSLKQQEEIFNAVQKILNEEERKFMTMEIEDVVGGRHDFLNQTGIKPSGELCKRCISIDCRLCIDYKEDRDGLKV